MVCRPDLGKHLPAISSGGIDAAMRHIGPEAAEKAVDRLVIVRR